MPETRRPIMLWKRLLNGVRRSFWLCPAVSMMNGQIQCKALQPVLKYGVIKERMAALITDALRADILEQNGYDTQILEFIDMEHTPKNLLIRAVKSGKMRPAGKSASLDEVMEFLKVNPTLKELL